MNFDIIQKNYNAGLWNKTMVGLAVKKGVITAEQYRIITGDDYTA